MAGSSSVVEEWLTVAEVAEHFKVQPRAVWRMVKEQRIPARKRGWGWFIHREDLPVTWPPPRSR